MSGLVFVCLFFASCTSQGAQGYKKALLKVRQVTFGRTFLDFGPSFFDPEFLSMFGSDFGPKSSDFEAF